MEPLQIIISAVDEASEQLQAIADSLDTISDAAESAASDANASLETIGVGAEDGVGGNVDAINAQLDTIATTAASAEDAASSDLDLIGAGSGDAVAANLAPAETAITGLKNSAASIGAVMTGVGMIANDIATPINNFTQTGIAGAQEYQAQLTSLGDLLSNQTSANGAASTAVQVADLTAKINLLNAENAKLGSTSSGSTQALAENQAQIAANNTTIASLTQQLDIQTNSLGMVGQNVGSITGQYTALATAAAKYGFTQQDALSALTSLQTQTHSTSDTLSDYNVILDLAAQQHESLTAAVQQMAGAFSGRGMAIQQATGIMVRDGLSAQSAFQAVGDVVNGAANKSLTDYATQTAAVAASTSDLETDALTPLLGTLTDLATKIDDILTKLINWVDAHQQLTKEIVEFLVIFGGLLAALGTFMVTFGPIVLILGVFGVGLAAALGWVALFAVGIAVLIALGVDIVNNWQHIEDTVINIWEDQMNRFHEIWEDLESWWKDLMASIEGWFFGELNSISDHWNNMLTSIQAFAKNIWATITNDAKTGINDFINIINGMINAIDSIKISIPAITIPGTKVGTPALNLGFDIPDIPLLAQGGIVVGPTLAMIGEAGPEAVVPLSSYGGGAIGGQPINIYIQGGNYLDKQGANDIATQLAKQIGRQIKLKSI